MRRAIYTPSLYPVLHTVPCFPQVRILVQKENAKLRAALVANLKSALITSFLMLPESFSEEELFLNIAGLSYSGDQNNLCSSSYVTRSLYVHDSVPRMKTKHSKTSKFCYRAHARVLSSARLLNYISILPCKYKATRPCLSCSEIPFRLWRRSSGDILSYCVVLGRTFFIIFKRSKILCF